MCSHSNLAHLRLSQTFHKCFLCESWHSPINLIPTHVDYGTVTRLGCSTVSQQNSLVTIRFMCCQFGTHVDTGTVTRLGCSTDFSLVKGAKNMVPTLITEPSPDFAASLISAQLQMSKKSNASLRSLPLRPGGLPLTLRGAAHSFCQILSPSSPSIIHHHSSFIIHHSSSKC